MVLHYNKLNKPTCLACSEADDKKLCINLAPNELKSRNSFIQNGFDTWTNAMSKFRNDESSSLHSKSVAFVYSLQSKKPVNQLLSDEKSQQMIKSRIALEIFFDSVSYLAESGIRGHKDCNSNLFTLLQQRSTDDPELKWWLENDNHRKWVHYEYTDKMLKLNKILKTVLREVRGAKYYELMRDEITDISKKEQVSYTVRTALLNLDPQELFLSFYLSSGHLV